MLWSSSDGYQTLGAGILVKVGKTTQHRGQVQLIDTHPIQLITSTHLTLGR